MSYTYTHFILFSDKYRFTTCGKLINTNTNNIIKKVYNNGCIGYNVDRKFKSKTVIKNNLREISELEQSQRSDDLSYILSQF